MFITISFISLTKVTKNSTFVRFKTLYNHTLVKIMNHLFSERIEDRPNVRLGRGNNFVKIVDEIILTRQMG
jgi:hypothetical protein